MRWFMVRLTCWAVLSACAVALALAVASCDRKTEQSATASAGSGEFEGTWNAAGTRRTIPLGNDRKGSIIDLRGTMLLTGADRPDVGFRVDVIGLVDSETGLVGRGVWKDEHGDQVFSELKGEGTKEKNHIEGKVLGGTGRFVGVTGSYEFSWEYVIESEDGSIQGRTVGLRGHYQLAQPAAGAAGGAK
jgi:hypothetical protein